MMSIPTQDNKSYSEFRQYNLSLPVIPGTDACSKALLRTEEVRDIIISSVVGDSINGLAYYLQ